MSLAWGTLARLTIDLETEIDDVNLKEEERYNTHDITRIQEERTCLVTISPKT